MRLGFVLPALVVVVLIGLLGYGLTRDPSELPSALLEQPAPAFSVSRLEAPDQVITQDVFAGQVAVFNVWASWCIACRTEHALIEELAERGEVPVYGLNYKDERATALRWLERYGDPFEASAFDPRGLVGIDYGVAAVPETFIIDADGVIRFKQVGPVDRETLEQTLLPLVARLKQEAT